MVWAGVFKYANGDLYDGEWKEDKQNRRGGGRGGGAPAVHRRGGAGWGGSVEGVEGMDLWQWEGRTGGRGFGGGGERDE